MTLGLCGVLPPLGLPLGGIALPFPSRAGLTAIGTRPRSCWLVQNPIRASTFPTVFTGFGHVSEGGEIVGGPLEPVGELPGVEFDQGAAREFAVGRLLEAEPLDRRRSGSTIRISCTLWAA